MFANGAVIAGRYHDQERDAAALHMLAAALPGREVVQLETDAIAVFDIGVQRRLAGFARGAQMPGSE